jgi:hypothetical protein
MAQGVDLEFKPQYHKKKKSMHCKLHPQSFVLMVFGGVFGK